MKRVVGALNPKLDGFEASCFDGRYITGDVSGGGLRRHRGAAQRARNDDEDSGDERTRLALQNADGAH